MLGRIAVVGIIALVLGAGVATAADLTGFTKQQSVTGLKDALQQGAANAVATLGKQDGFLGNPKVKIPLPGPLAKGEQVMRMLGMGKQADELIVAMNRAAEEAVPEAKTLLTNAVKQMSVADAKGILSGGEDSATKYFRSKTETTLRAKFLPIVTKTTSRVGLAQKYNEVAGKAAATGLVEGDETKVETYVTQKALDGLFLMMAEEEKAFRQNPMQAGSDLAKKIFESLRR
jgi:hypothetical protein